MKHVPLVSPYSHSSSINPGLWKSASLVYTRTYILALLLLLRRLCTFWCSILFSGQRSFVFLCCDTRVYRRFRGCPVVLDIELSMSAWHHKIRRALLCARRLLLMVLLTAESKERRLAVCGITSKPPSYEAETKLRLGANQNTRNFRHTQNTSV